MLKHRGYLQKLIVVMLVLQAILFSFTGSLKIIENPKLQAVSQYQVKKEFKISPGVNYREEQLNEGLLEESVRIMEIDLNDDFTTIEMGVPQPFPNLETVTSQARSNSEPNHRTVGAINASFYHTNNYLPAYLISMNQSLYNLGAISASADGYMSVPTAFGMDQSGKAVIGRYDLNIRFLHDDGVVHVDSINKEREKGDIILFTPSYRFDYTRTNEYGIEITVANTTKSLDTDQLKFGDIIQGKVTSIRRYGDKNRSEIPDDGFVLSIQGGALAEQFKYTDIGENIFLKIDIDEKWKNTDFMLASGPMLVENGKVNLTINQDSYRASERHPRTAVGTNADGTNVYFITVDGRQNGYSDGMDLTEFSKYIHSLGIHTAINLDGGGSTTMIAREYGNIYPTVVNQPSDGGERRVSTTLQVINTAPIGKATHLGVHKVKEGKIVKGSSVRVEADYLLDEYYHPLDLVESNVTYRVDNQVGHMEGTTFIADQAGKGNIVAQYAGTTTNIPVEVVGKVDRLEITPKNLKIGEGKTQKFEVQAYSEDGSNLIFDENTVTWSVNGQVGDIDNNGLFKSIDKPGKGHITVTLNDQVFTESIEVGQESIVLDHFKDSSLWNLASVRSRGHFRASEGFEPVIEGDSSLRFGYNFATGETGTAATYLVRNKSIKLEGKPNHIGMWVYGDTHAHWLRGKIIDGSGSAYTIDFTEIDKLNWNGWKYVKAEIPDQAQLPLKFERVYVAEANEKKKDWGVLFLDKLVASYQVKNDIISDSVTYDVVDKNKEWQITFNTELLASSVTNETIYVLNKDGQRLETTVTLDSSKKVVRVSAPQSGYTGTQFYSLEISNGVKSATGHNMKVKTNKIFKVN